MKQVGGESMPRFRNKMWSRSMQGAEGGDGGNVSRGDMWRPQIARLRIRGEPLRISDRCKAALDRKKCGHWAR